MNLFLQASLKRRKISFSVCYTITLCVLSLPSSATLFNNPIANISKNTTVYIDGKNHGSGVIIQRQGTTYTILSAAHVFNPQTQYTILTADGQRHPIAASSIKPLPNVDLATAQFNSTQTYSIAKLGNSIQVKRKDLFYISGYTATPNSIKPTYHFRSGQIEANAPHPIDQGYALAFYAKTYPGMSGGPILNNQGHLIGIQGLSLVPSPNARTINPLGDLTDRLYLAIPINTFIAANGKNQPTLNPALSQPLTADDYFIQGNLEYTKSNPTAALNHYNNAIRLAPDYAPAYYGRANLRADAKDTQSAISDYTQALKLNPSYTQAYYYRGGLYAEIGHFENAMADYGQALTLNPNFAVVHNNRGTIRFRLGDLKGAIADYNQAIQKNPNLRDAYSNRGLARYKLGDLKNAIRDYTQAIQIEPTRAITYSNRALVYLGLGDRTAATLDLQKAADLYRNQGDMVHYNEVLRLIQRISQ